jgi:hypothetical protein
MSNTPRYHDNSLLERVVKSQYNPNTITGAHVAPSPGEASRDFPSRPRMDW